MATRTSGPRLAFAAALLGLLLLAPSGVAPDQPFTRFAHPTDGDSVARGASVRVTAIAMHQNPPVDARLEYSEDRGQTWTAVTGAEVQGRSIGGTYEPGSQDSIVKFRTISSTSPWFTSQVEVVLD
jgi:hypothetical protein